MLVFPTQAHLQPFATRAAEQWNRLRQNPRARAVALFLYYLGVLLALLIIYGRGDFKTAPFVYQGF